MAKMYKRLKVESKTASLRIIENAIDEMTGAIGINQDNYGKILVATLEAVNNAIKHGNKEIPEKLVDVVIEFIDNELRISVTDQGDGFDPARIPDPTLPANIEELSGRGVFLMTKLSDAITFNEKGNSVTMSFKEVTD
ncbi:MAG: ATP-binding protein [Bacteroidales bacterium]|jgi:serine/threonine-protein kinase RsbW|nr:ATP-binding protein [Bacteroidales bacterium]